ncbi:MarR family winged helix-turn-helix transcriptional regulator [Sphingomonas sp. MMS24-J13]|uniref:MarR family winged helix-turn-helix transcriptional regulator n=1 Tax=Sphingomonas sp. MMS24-J13 TaxID=3238686 RepID=UPI00384F7728
MPVDSERELTFPHLIKWVEMATRARVDRAMRDSPVSSSQLFALALLNGRGEATSAELARLMHLTPQAMTTLLRPLRDAGLIERHADADHGRRLQWRLGDKGRALLREVHDLCPALEDDLLEGFDPAERATLKALLARIALRFG